MLICQYDTMSKDFDLITVQKMVENLEKEFPEEIVVAIPSYLSILDLSDEDGLQELEQIYRFLGENISLLKGIIENNDKSKDDAIRYMDICSSSPIYQEAWQLIKKEYNI